MSDNTLNIALTVSVGCVVGILTSFATFSYNQGTESQKLDSVIERMQMVEKSVVDVSNLGSTLEVMSRDMSYMRNEFDGLKSQMLGMSEDIEAVNIYIAREEGKREAIESLQRSGVETHGN